MSETRMLVEQWRQRHPVEYGEICTAVRTELGLTSLQPMPPSQFKRALGRFEASVRARVLATVRSTPAAGRPGEET
jgi:hypothetical protein